MTSKKDCYVYIVLPGQTEFVTAARFELTQTREGAALGKLIYGRKYLARQDAVEIDPIELKLTQNEFTTIRLNGFFGGIRDAMPDYWGREVIAHHVHKTLTDFDYLLYGPDDRAGALGFGLNVDPTAPKKEFSKTMDLEYLQRLAESILSNRPIEESFKNDAQQIEELLLEGTSMGGARPKAVVEDNGALWIAKFSTPQDRWNQPLVEYALLTLAKECGLHVAESKIVTVAGKDVLLVKRFDRDKTQEGYYRHRMVSALTLLKSDESSTLRENWSYLLLADEVRRVSNMPEDDLKELYKRMCFNALVSNLDDHPRNHAILASNQHWRLSPAYDLTPTITITQDTRMLAMSCGEQGRVANKTNLLTAHHRFMLEKEEALAIIEKMSEAIKSNWYSVLRRCGVSETDCSTVSSAFVNSGFVNQ